MTSVKRHRPDEPRTAGEEKAEGAGERLDSRRGANEGQDMHGSSRTALGTDAII